MAKVADGPRGRVAVERGPPGPLRPAHGRGDGHEAGAASVRQGGGVVGPEEEGRRQQPAAQERARELGLQGGRSGQAEHRRHAGQAAVAQRCAHVGLYIGGPGIVRRARARASEWGSAFLP